MQRGSGGTSRRERVVEPPRPFFNAELRELWLGGVLVKRLDCRAVNQILVLTVFQEEGWPPRIDDPLPPRGTDAKARLRDTIYSLNGGHRGELIRFFCDGAGHGVRWELVRPG